MQLPPKSGPKGRGGAATEGTVRKSDRNATQRRSRQPACVQKIVRRAPKYHESHCQAGPFLGYDDEEPEAEVQPAPLQQDQATGGQEQKFNEEEVLEAVPIHSRDR